MKILSIFDIILFLIFGINVFYLLIFSIASKLGKKKKPTAKAASYKRIAVLIPAYKEDTVIEECAGSCLKQAYPKDKYEVVVISDRMEQATNERLRSLGARIIEVFFENSTKAKALNHAMAELGDEYDIAVVLDADNTVFPDFLTQVNDIFALENTRIVQAHRCTKNTNTKLAILDSVSEEINNNIYRQGHVNLGLSAALIGSGMAFEYGLFKKTMLRIDAVGGFDRALELEFMKDGIHVLYMPDTLVLDEKIQYHDDFSRQRRRWLSAQLHYMRRSLKEILPAIKAGNIDQCDKIFQQMTMPRLLLLGFLFIITVVVSFIDLGTSVKWWVLFALLLFALTLAIPKSLFTKQLLKATLDIPYTFLLMALSLFKLKGANKKFIHTKHGSKKA